MDHTLALIMKSQQGDKEARDTVFKEKRRTCVQHGEKICPGAVWKWKISCR